MRSTSKQKILVVLFILLLLPLGAGAFGLPELGGGDGIKIKFNINYPSIPAPVQGGKFDLNCVEGQSTSDFCSAEFIYAPTIGNLILFVFITAIWMGGIVAFVSLIYAGFMYILSGANPSMRARARQRLTNVLWGIAILLFATITINMINPDIASLRISNQRNVSSQNPKEPSINDPKEIHGGFSCSWDGSVSKCKLDKRCDPGFVETLNCGDFVTESTCNINGVVKACVEGTGEDPNQTLSNTVHCEDTPESNIFDCKTVKECKPGFISDVQCESFSQEDCTKFINEGKKWDCFDDPNI